MLYRIEQLIKQRGWSVSEFERQLGVSRGTFSNWKRGLASTYKEKLSQIARLLNTSEAYLRGETDDPSPNQDASPSPYEIRTMVEMLTKLGIRKDDGSYDDTKFDILLELLKTYEKFKQFEDG